MAAVQLILCLLFAFFQGAASLRWSSSSPPEGQVLYVCRNSNVIIPWDYLLDAGDSVDEVTWLYDGHSQEIIAIMTHGQFLVMPAFSHRVQASGNAGLSLTGVQVGDSGNYTIEVRVFKAMCKNSCVGPVFLHVTDQLMTVDGSVHVTQSSEVILDPRTGQYSVQLQCGQWISADNPPFQVEWVTPDGQVVNSSDFNDHHFTLTLPPPIKGGNYTCRIPPQHADLACLHGNAGHQEEATVFVDKMDAQLSILLKENQQLKERLDRTDSQLAATQSELTETKSELTQTKSDLTQTKSDLTQTKSELTQVKNQLSSTNATESDGNCCHDVQGRLQKLEDAARHQVAFHARNLQSGHPPSGTPLIFNHVVLNQGQAYNSTSGYFVSPYKGLYYFAASTAELTTNQESLFELYVDNTWITGSLSYYDGNHRKFSTLQAVVHLDVGQRVSIDNFGSGIFDTSGVTVFTGFLLAHDFD